MTMPSSGQPPHDRNHGGLPFDRTPNGYDVTPAILPTQSGRFPCVAVVGVKGANTWAAVLMGMASHIEEGAPDDVQRTVAAVRFFLAVNDSGPWSIPGARAKTLFRKLDYHETDRAVRHALDECDTYDQSASPPKPVQVELALSTYSTGQTPASDRARIYELAVVGGGGYGEVHPEMCEEVATWAQENSERCPPRPDGSDFRQLARQLETALETAREANDWARLAALRELVLSGRSHLNNNLTSLQTAAINDTARWAKATHGPEIPPRLRETLREGDGLHKLFYRQRPEFGDQPWMFRSCDGVLTLKLPSVVDYACQCWGEKWLDGLFEDFANGDTATQESRLDRLSALCALIGSSRATGDITPRSQKVGGKRVENRPLERPLMDSQEEEEYLDQDGEDLPRHRAAFKLTEQERAVFARENQDAIQAFRRRVEQLLTLKQQAAFLPGVLDEVKQRDLANRLGVTEGAVSQLISGGWSRLKQGDPVLHDQLRAVQPPKT